MIVACYHPLPLSACTLHFDFVSILFGTSIPTSFNILVKMFYTLLSEQLNYTVTIKIEDDPTSIFFIFFLVFFSFNWHITKLAQNFTLIETKISFILSVVITIKLKPGVLRTSFLFYAILLLAHAHTLT